jgi:hypothetical protein
MTRGSRNQAGRPLAHRVRMVSEIGASVPQESVMPEMTFAAKRVMTCLDCQQETVL